MVSFLREVIRMDIGKRGAPISCTERVKNKSEATALRIILIYTYFQGNCLAP